MPDGRSRVRKAVTGSLSGYCHGVKKREHCVSRGALMRHGGGDRSSNSHAAEEGRKTITARSVLPRTGQIQSQHAAFQ